MNRLWRKWNFENNLPNDTEKNIHIQTWMNIHSDLKRTNTINDNIVDRNTFLIKFIYQQRVKKKSIFNTLSFFHLQKNIRKQVSSSAERRQKIKFNSLIFATKEALQFEYEYTLLWNINNYDDKQSGTESKVNFKYFWIRNNAFTVNDGIRWWNEKKKMVENAFI